MRKPFTQPLDHEIVIRSIISSKTSSTTELRTPVAIANMLASLASAGTASATPTATLAELGESMEVQQRMMRHTDIKTTMGYGDPKIDKQRRVANNNVYEMVKKRTAR